MSLNINNYMFSIQYLFIFYLILLQFISISWFFASLSIFLSDSDNHIHMISDLRIKADIHINWIKLISSMFSQFQKSTNETKIKNWTISQIKTEFKLNNNEYNIIYTVLKKELRKKKLLKLKLNTVIKKKNWKRF